MVEIPLNLARKISLFGQEFPEEVNRFYLRTIKKAFEEKAPHAIYYKIEGTPIVAGVPAKSFPETLKDMINDLVEVELYELASECKELLDRIMIERLIEESK